jgi:hypothetical protein
MVRVKSGFRLDPAQMSDDDLAEAWGQIKYVLKLEGLWKN